MKKKVFTNYVDFLNILKNKKDRVTSVTCHDNIISKFKIGSQLYEYEYDSRAVPPNKFIKLLGFERYSAFTTKRFSHIKDFAKTEEDVKKWYAGYMGGLIGVNSLKINDFVGNCEQFTYYDYDLNKAYLEALIHQIPTKFVGKYTPEDYLNLDRFERERYMAFYEIQIDYKSLKDGPFKLFGNIRGIYRDFDFLNSGRKAQGIMIVSELRYEILRKVYLDDFIITNIYLFEKRQFDFYKNILNRYLQVKDNYGSEFKKNALRLYGNFGQIYKKEVRALNFEKNGRIDIYYDKFINEQSSPQVAMWVADSIALRLFDLISNNLDRIICWNTDGFTAVKPVKVQISNRPGKWKLKIFKGIAFLPAINAKRVVFKNTVTNDFYGADSIFEKRKKIYTLTEYTRSDWQRGIVKEVIKTKINLENKFSNKDDYRSVFIIEKTKELMKKKEDF